MAALTVLLGAILYARELPVWAKIVAIGLFLAIAMRRRD